jgi:CheY-like chemotaxis protein
MMARRGHTMTAVSDGAAAVELAARHDYDLILMDFQMPTVDGLSATRAIHAAADAAGRPRVPVIAMTASVLAEHRRASVDAGMAGFASKPVDWFTLSHEIARVLGLGALESGEEEALGERQALNLRAGLHRWGGNEDAYGEALAHFDAQNAHLARLLSEHAEAGESRALRMLAHKVRGAAANVGLERLADALARLEQHAGADALDAESFTEPLQSAMAAVAGALDEALAAVRDHAPGAPAASVAAGGADLERARRAGAVLLNALRRGALDDAALAGLAAALGAHPAAGRVTQVQAALADFDFDLAVTQLEAALALIDHDTPQEAAQ